MDDLARLVNGFQISQAVHVAAALNIGDLLADGALPNDELADATGTHAPTLYRLLRALASVGVLSEGDDRRFALTELGEQLRTDHPQSVHGWAAFVGRSHVWNTWSGLLRSVQTGENAFAALHGMDVWQYRRDRPEEGAAFDRAMTSHTQRANAALIEAYDFGRFRVVVDVAGGNGALLAALLAAYPEMQGILFDQPQVVSGARELLENAGVADRCALVAGSFFDSVPESGDAYVLKAIIHDWEDPESIAILRNVRRTGGHVLLIERVVGAPNEDSATKFSDLNMLVMPGGRERTLEEFDELLSRADFRRGTVTPTDSGLAVIEGVPA